MPKVQVQNGQGSNVGEMELSDRLFGMEPKVGVMHRTVVAEQAHQRQGTHDTLTRAEVRGGGRKPWKQKHTGRARQGSIRAPHWRHGGIVHGPHPRNHAHAVNKKERRLAMASALSAKLQAGDFVVLNDLGITEMKTRQAASLLKHLGVDEQKVLVILHEQNETVWKSFRNLPDVIVRVAPAFSVQELLGARKIIVTQDAIKKMEEVWAS
jgi:large subunit ribosomal protein L4